MGLGRPVSRILLYPAIHLRGYQAPGSLGEPRLPCPEIRTKFGLLAPVVYLAGPSRDTAGGLLPHPFTHHLCRRILRPSAGLLSVALDVAAGLRRAAPRVVSPSGLSGPGGSTGSSRVRTLLCVPGEKPGTQRQVGRPRPSLNYTLLGQVLGSRRRARAPPRLRRTILVGVRRSSTLSVLVQRFSQRGSSPTVGSNQMPGPSGSITPSYDEYSCGSGSVEPAPPREKGVGGRKNCSLR